MMSALPPKADMCSVIIDLVARQAKLSVRLGVALSVLDWRLRAGSALLRGRGLSPRGTCRGLDLRQIILRRRLGLRHSSAHEVRGHVGRRRWRCGEISYRAGIHRIRMPRLWQTDAVAGDYWRRTGFQRCIRDEQQRDQRQTDYCKKGESWHCRVPTRTSRLFKFLVRARHLQAGEQLDVALRVGSIALESYALPFASRGILRPLAYKRCSRFLFTTKAARITGLATGRALIGQHISLAGFAEVECRHFVGERGKRLCNDSRRTNHQHCKACRVQPT